MCMSKFQNTEYVTLNRTRAAGSFPPGLVDVPQKNAEAGSHSNFFKISPFRSKGSGATSTQQWLLHVCEKVFCVYINTYSCVMRLACARNAKTSVTFHSPLPSPQSWAVGSWRTFSQKMSRVKKINLTDKMSKTVNKTNLKTNRTRQMGVY